MLKSGNTREEGEGNVGKGITLEHRRADFAWQDGLKAVIFSGNFLNLAVPLYSLKAFNFPPRNRVGEHRRTGAGPVQPKFPSEPFEMV